MAENNRRILITGANGGMGRLCTTLAISEGYTHLVLTDLPSPQFDQFAASLRSDNVTVSSHNLDVTDAGAVQSFVDNLGGTAGIDAVIHTVGVSPNMTNWQRIIDIDLVSTARFLTAIMPHLGTGCGAVCISSSSGYMVPTDETIEQLLANPLGANFFENINKKIDNPLENPGYAYSYAKKALRQFVATQAVAWGAEGKRLVSISPGLIDTEAGQAEYKASKNFSALVSSVPLKRLGLPEEIANTALFLVSPKASYSSGCDILVDGGMIAAMGKSV